MSWIDDTPEQKSLATYHSVDIRHTDVYDYDYSLEDKTFCPIASVNHVYYNCNKHGFLAILHTSGYQKNSAVFENKEECKSFLDKMVEEWKKQIDEFMMQIKKEIS